jgi:hypothetical protein
MFLEIFLSQFLELTCISSFESHIPSFIFTVIFLFMSVCVWREREFFLHLYCDFPVSERVCGEREKERRGS